MRKGPELRRQGGKRAWERIEHDQTIINACIEMSQ